MPWWLFYWLSPEGKDLGVVYDIVPKLGYHPELITYVF